MLYFLLFGVQGSFSRRIGGLATVTSCANPSVLPFVPLRLNIKSLPELRMYHDGKIVTSEVLKQDSRDSES